jgi:hypothetical protein
MEVRRTQRTGGSALSFHRFVQELDEPAPTDVDPKGEWYAFERGATKTTGGEDWADVWKRDHCGWNTRESERISAPRSFGYRRSLSKSVSDGNSRECGLR